jgi:hypothetical protein
MKVGEVLKITLLDGCPIHLERLPDDPHCPRISAGGMTTVGFYINFRGELPQIKEMLDILQKNVAIIHQGWSEIQSTIKIIDNLKK